ncbi:MAG TPA: MFS transporter [Candidatus Rubneribacter avistercoris]|nr:MFS transporter [Candidatus Rubneribacter avistercoris]
MSANTLQGKSGGLYYGWVVYIAVCVCMFLACAFTFNTASIYYDSVATAFDTGRANVGFYMTLVYGTACVANLFWAGPLLEKLDLRIILSAAVALVGVALLIMSNAQSIAWFYVAGVLMGLGNAWLLWLIVPVVVGRWFKKRRGTLIGVGMACTSISGTLLSPVFSGIIESTGWRSAYLYQAILVLVICLPLSIFVVRSRPEDKGLKPLGWDDPEILKAESEAQTKTDGVTLKQALKRPSTFILCCVFAGLANIGLTMNYFFPSFATSLGYDAATGALLASTIMLASLFGKLILGFLNDRSIVLSNIVGIVPMMIGLACMIFFGASNSMWLFFGAVCFGVFFAVQPTNVPQVARKLFGNVSYDRIFTYVAVVMPLCAAFGSTFWGWIYDTTGSYSAAFVLDIIIGALALVALFASLKTSKDLWAWAAKNPDKN